MKTRSSMSSRKSKIEVLRSNFYFDENGRPDIYRYGIFRSGLTLEEVDAYLLVRSGKTVGIKKLRKQFSDLFGCGTAPLVVCPRCKKNICLLYRHDVERFANVMFENTPTYFD